MALADAFAEQFKGVSHAQVAAMNWLDWAVSLAEFVAAAGTVFAAYLNVTPGLVSKWERGEKHPQGASLKLLSLVEKKGLEIVA